MPQNDNTKSLSDARTPEKDTRMPEHDTITPENNDIMAKIDG